MKKRTISYDEVKQHVESLPEGAKVGGCGDAHTCIIVGALLAKYPEFKGGVSVYPQGDDNQPSMYGFGKRGAIYMVTTPDARKLNRLAERFDSLHGFGIAATKTEVLPLFEE